MSELETFVLDYLEEAGSLIEPPAYRIYEVILPEAIAERWDVPAYLQLAFTDTEREEAIRLGYNHPLVEKMVKEAHNRSASTCFSINNLRLDKKGIDEIAIKQWAILNARAQPQKRSTVSRVRSVYVRFNFKAAILSEEKQERLVSVLMDAHTGSRVVDTELIESRATAVTADDILASLPDAPMRWQPKDGTPLKRPLDETTLAALLERAKTAVLQEMQADLSTLQKRVTRFRQLDEARLADYYDTLAHDLQGRLRSASPERRAGLQDKLTAVQTERTHKLADLAERYQVRINLELLNLLVIQQPKLIQAVEIANRSTRISAYAVWDPLRHQLEPLPCQVCERPAQRLYLCHNGHLAHEDCLAPACIDCKRVFCQDCAHDVGRCDVCHQPLCRHSQLTCRDCGRHTCQEHKGLCHANDGRPVDLTTQTPPEPEPEPEPEPAPRPKTPPARTTRSKSPPPAAKTRAKPVRPAYRGPKVLRIEVVLDSDVVAAYLLGKRERQVAMRIWELNPEHGGILRNCQCEKGADCKADGMILRPFPLPHIEKQIRDELTNLANEYNYPPEKINYNRLSSPHLPPVPVGRFTLFGLWKNEAVLNAARIAFDRL
jgi:hypothetical protein